jgi:ArsR family transcriptional regulator, arsenate/arsenite/antimonite-responsive transcriptional repressor
MSIELELLQPICCSTSAPPLARDEAAQVASGFKALADPARVQLLHLVSSSEAAESCVCDLTAALGLSQGTVSHHLKVLVEAGLLERERRGTWAWYRLVPTALTALAGTLTVPSEKVPVLTRS